MAIALVALITIPSIYAGLYLWANEDPYGNMVNVPVALVNEDVGSQINGQAVNIGSQINTELLQKRPFDLQVTDRNGAYSGVDSDKYAFAIILPNDFTANIKTIYSSIITDDTWNKPTPATIELVTNDANNFIVHTVADTVGGTLKDMVTLEVSEQLTKNLLAGLSDIHAELAVAVGGSGEIVSGLVKLNDGTKQYQAGLNTLKSAIDQLNSGVNQLYSGAIQIADGTSLLNQYSQIAATVEKEFNNDWNTSILPNIKSFIDNNPALDTNMKLQLNTILNSLQTVVDDFHTKATSLFDNINNLSEGSAQLAGGLKTITEQMPLLMSGVTQLTDTFAQFSDGIKQLTDGSQALNSGLIDGYNKIPNLTEDQINQISQVVATPVIIRNNSQVTASGYANGLMPFFVALSAWIGAYSLFVLIKPLNRKILEKRRNLASTTVASYFVPALVGFLQMLLLFVVVAFVLGMTPVHPVLSLLTMLLTSLTYTMILFVLVLALKRVGLFMGLVLLVLQLTASGGTFPWQTTPYFFHIIHQVFPMSYAVDAFRHTFYGGNTGLIVRDALFLGGWFAVFAVIACFVMNFLRKKQ